MRVPSLWKALSVAFQLVDTNAWLGPLSAIDVTLENVVSIKITSSHGALALCEGLYDESLPGPSSRSFKLGMMFLTVVHGWIAEKARYGNWSTMSLRRQGAFSSIEINNAIPNLDLGYASRL